jgi:2-oxoglutarate ferredoxin oxidoreductase subunit gamma
VLFTGIGGQGVQIVAKALASAAVHEGRSVLLVPRYGGIMRGGKTNAELTVGDGRLRGLPVVTDAWSGFVMDQSYWDTIKDSLAADAVLLVNSTLFHQPVQLPRARLYELAATDIATDLGSPMSAAFVMLGAFAALTGLVRVESVTDAMRELVPAYRTQHVAANERAIEAGAAAVPRLAAPAWPDVAVA